MGYLCPFSEFQQEIRSATLHIQGDSLSRFGLY